MADDTTDINTEGGSSVQGDANAGRDLVGRDQYNYYNAPPPTIEPQVIKEEINALYRQATAAHFLGDLVQAQELYERVQKLDPYFPGVSRVLLMVKNESKRTYVDLAGRVVERQIIVGSDWDRYNYIENTEKLDVKRKRLLVLVVIVSLALALVVWLIFRLLF